MSGKAQATLTFTQSHQQISELLQLLHEVSDLQALLDRADWDAQTAMPDGARGARSQQMALLQGFIHERLASPRLGKLLGQIERSSELQWLQERMYQFGAIYQTEDLMKRVSGKAPDPQYLVQHLTLKFSRLYLLETGEEERHR